MPKNRTTDILELENFLPYRLARAAEQVSREFAEIYKGQTGMTRPEWRAFATIGQFGEVTATFIGQHSSMHKTKVSRAIVGLEQRRWIVRRQDTEDRRVEHLCLTREGAREYLTLSKLAKEFQDNLLAQLGLQSATSLMDGLARLEHLSDL